MSAGPAPLQAAAPAASALPPAASLLPPALPAGTGLPARRSLRTPRARRVLEAALIEGTFRSTGRRLVARGGGFCCPALCRALPRVPGRAAERSCWGEEALRPRLSVVSCGRAQPLRALLCPCRPSPSALGCAWGAAGGISLL